MNGRRSGTGVRACIDEVLAGREDRDDYLNAQSLLLTISKGKQKLVVTNNRTDVLDELRELVTVDRVGESRRRHYTTMCMLWRNEIADGQC